MKQLIQGYKISAGVRGSAAANRSKFGGRGGDFSDPASGEVPAERLAKEFAVRAALESSDALSPSTS